MSHTLLWRTQVADYHHDFVFVLQDTTCLWEIKFTEYICKLSADLGQEIYILTYHCVIHSIDRHRSHWQFIFNLLMEIFRGSVEALGGKSVQKWRGKILCLMLSPAPLQQSLIHQPKVWRTARKCRNKCDCATFLLHYYGTWFVLRYYLLVTILIQQSATLPTPEM